MIKGNEWMRKEIESHSSSLTNMSILQIIDKVTENAYLVMSSPPSGQATISLFGSVFAWFLRTHPIYTEEMNKEIKARIDTLIKDGYGMMMRMRMLGSNPIEAENLNNISLELIYLMTQGMQNLRYFFRLNTKEIKGIDAALDIFNNPIWKIYDGNKKVNGVQRASGAEPSAAAIV